MAEPQQPQQPRQRQRHYKPRICRICLEVVQPSLDTDAMGSIPGIFTPRPRVTYVSEDPELGRLISPCKCKGSQKYVHEGCLQAWRTAAPLSDRNYWKCPTCAFKYRMERLRLGRWVSNAMTRGVLTALIFFFTIFLLGFVADPIISLMADPWGSLADTLAEVVSDVEGLRDFEVAPEENTWGFHFLKGFLSFGLLGAVKSFFAMYPWQWYIRLFGGGGRRGNGRNRLESINLFLVLIGVLTFIGATWKFVRYLSARILERASDRVVDVQGDDDEDEDGDEAEATGPDPESRKDI